MQLVINGDNKTIEKEAVSISELLVHEQVDMPEMVTVNINGDIIDRGEFESYQIKEGDKIEFLYFMGGGCT